ncbi:hypothetical protein NDU88_002328 [Pleurodeles waltl]|uniref:Uncharacterized protein n=1 Tax=Pleurodeles waltl TaxID=8319 RepID=A0AAV7UZG0_PLEWA|nr:hypothetical protein NDU88_002328 [Pleurodeles waltl]
MGGPTPLLYRGHWTLDFHLLNREVRTDYRNTFAHPVIAVATEGGVCRLLSLNDLCLCDGGGTGVPLPQLVLKNGRNKQATPFQWNTIKHSTVATPLLQCQTQQTGQREDQDASASVEEPPHAELHAAIQGSRSALEGKIESMALEVNLLRTDRRKVLDKVKLAEDSIVELQMKGSTPCKQLAHVNLKSETLEARLKDAEGRSHQNSVCLLAFLQRVGGNSAEVFVQRWIRNMLKSAGFSTMFTIERAYRTHATIVRILNYRDPDCILRAFMETNNAVFVNHRISTFPDYSNKVQNSRKNFLEV